MFAESGSCALRRNKTLDAGTQVPDNFKKETAFHNLKRMASATAENRVRLLIDMAFTANQVHEVP